MFYVVISWIDDVVSWILVKLWFILTYIIWKCKINSLIYWICRSEWLRFSFFFDLSLYNILFICRCNWLLFNQFNLPVTLILHAVNTINWPRVRLIWLKRLLNGLFWVYFFSWDINFNWWLRIFVISQLLNLLFIYFFLLWQIVGYLFLLLRTMLQWCVMKKFIFIIKWGGDYIFRFFMTKYSWTVSFAFNNIFTSAGCWYNIIALYMFHELWLHNITLLIIVELAHPWAELSAFLQDLSLFFTLWANCLLNIVSTIKTLLFHVFKI